LAALVTKTVLEPPIIDAHNQRPSAKYADGLSP
jgi:hypothetical protein